jgi:hypothetical protein
MLQQETISSIEDAANRVDGLQSQIQGRVIIPGDPEYDQARQAWNLAVDQHPAMIVIPENTSDAALAVRHARQQALKIAVQSTGHGVTLPADGSMLILTSRLKEVRIDPEAHTAWVAAGVKWGQVLEACGPFSLAPLLGSSPDVGAIGYTLGGGMGWLGRKYGLSTDSVNFFELVTPNGQILRASSTENSDLFWGLRGGGGNFGLVTGMEIRLYPITEVYGGNLIYPLEAAREVFTHYRAWIAEAPDELTSSIVIMNFPPLPIFPEPLRGQTVVMVRGCYCGSLQDGQALLDSWRDWKTPMIDDFKRMPFTQVATISNDPVDPMPGLSSSAWLRDLSDETIEILLQYGAAHAGPCPLIVAEVRHVGGAVAKADPRASAYGNREATLLLQMIGMTPTPQAHQELKAYVESFKLALSPHLTGGVYINFLEGEENQDRSKDAYTPENYRRLQSLKAQYDPDNIFSHAINIPPLT